MNSLMLKFSLQLVPDAVQFLTDWNFRNADIGPNAVLVRSRTKLSIGMSRLVYGYLATKSEYLPT